MSPCVSVVITTRDRPQLLGRAVASALAQTFQDIEVIVVVDGADAASAARPLGIEDPRLQVHVRETRGGQPAAINSGVHLATGPWIALLDDDDEWMPEKLETQLRVAETSRWAKPIVGCRFRACSELDDVVWPLRSPRMAEPVCEYLFCRTLPQFGEGVLPTSMLFAPGDLFRDNPMDEELHHHCDLDWLVRVDERADVGLEMPPGGAPLGVWHMQGGRDRLSNSHDWRFSYAWISRSRQRVTSRAYAGFLLTWVSPSARLQGDFKAFPFLLRAALQSGSPRALDLAVYAAVWGLSPKVRGWVSHALSSRYRFT